MFVAKYKCSDCSHVFERKTERDPKKGGRRPGCPACKQNTYPTLKSTSKSNVDYTPEKLEANHRGIVESKKFPAMGKSNFTKAMDATAEIVMQDYGMTNLQDNLREGDSMAPKLPPELEQRVNDAFKPKKPIMGQRAAGSLNTALMGQINSGAFANQFKSRDIVAEARDYGQTIKNSTGHVVPTREIYAYDDRKPH